MTKFGLYTVKAKYTDYLRQKDPKIPYTGGNKSTRPFVGIVFQQRGFNYFVPFTSPKPKHLHMKNQIDFLKIENGALGAINFNNMIPVSLSALSKIDLKKKTTDSQAELNYKFLLQNQLEWCNKNSTVVTKYAEHLYKLIVQGKAYPQLKQRCCDFKTDEMMCLKYEKENGVKTVTETSLEEKIKSTKQQNML